MYKCDCIENLLVGYRKANPPKAKIAQKYHPDIQIPPTTGYRKNTPKIPEKYPQNTNFVFFCFRGVSEKVFRGVSFLYVKGYFWISGLSYSVAGRWVLNDCTCNHQKSNPPKQKKGACNHFDDKGMAKKLGNKVFGEVRLNLLALSTLTPHIFTWGAPSNCEDLSVGVFVWTLASQVSAAVGLWSWAAAQGGAQKGGVILWFCVCSCLSACACA